MPAVSDETIYLTPGELSGILLISDIEISRLARLGILPRIPSPTKSNSFLYPLVDCARQYIRHLKSAGQQDRDRYWKARAKSEKEKAHALSIANGLRDGHFSAHGPGRGEATGACPYLKATLCDDSGSDSRLVGR